MPEIEICAHCGQEEELHAPGQPCPDPPKVVQCGMCMTTGPIEHINSTPCPHLTMQQRKEQKEAEEAAKPEGERRKRGRPPGSGYAAHAYRQGKKLSAHQEAEIRQRLAAKGLEILTKPETRMRNRPNPPERTIAQCKDAALKLLNQQLWNLEGLAEKEGLTEDEEARLLKLLAGVNAALPKTAELPVPKPLSEMTEDEIKAVMKGR